MTGWVIQSASSSVQTAHVHVYLCLHTLMQPGGQQLAVGISSILVEGSHSTLQAPAHLCLIVADQFPSLCVTQVSARMFVPCSMINCRQTL
jgi:hypothetical protein